MLDKLGQVAEESEMRKTSFGFIINPLMQINQKDQELS